VLGTSKGWLTLQLSDGNTVKARARDVRFSDGPGGITNRRVGNRRYDCSKYKAVSKGVKSVGGHATLDNGDELAKSLRGAELDDVYKQASKILRVPQTELRAKYAKLNVGMQRMNLGNRMRSAMATEEADAE
jgi:hypothetical protein